MISDISSMYIGNLHQPCVIINTDSVISLLEFEIFNIRGVVEERIYNPQSFNVIANTRNGMLIGPPGSIFELKHPEFDIIGTAL